MKRMLLCTLLPLSVGLLSGCTDEYYREPGYDNRPSNDYSVPRYELIDNCQERVEYRAQNRYGHRTHVSFGRTNVYYDSRYDATVRGQAIARNNGRSHDINYDCRMSRESGRVRNLDMGWEDHNDHQTNSGEWDRKAVQSCKNRIRQRINNEVKRNHTLAFEQQQLTRTGKKRRHVKGEAKVKVKQGNGRISYNCDVKIKPLQLQSASYRWTRPLPAKPTHNAHEKAKKLCRNALQQKLQRNGYHNIHFLAINVRDLEGHRKKANITVRADKKHSTSVQHYSCTVNTKRKRILELRLD